LFVRQDGEEGLTRAIENWIGADTPFHGMVYQKKFLILQVSLASELHMLAHQLDGLAQKNRGSRDFTLNTFAACPPRGHRLLPRVPLLHHRRGRGRGGSSPPSRWQRAAPLSATPTLSRSLFRFVRDMLLLEYPEAASEADRAEQRRFTGKFQQVTGPVMAKGVEDTAFYEYNRLLSLNEVGGNPGRFRPRARGSAPLLLARQAKWPHALSPLSTHDTKRSEDVRARLNVLSELPEEMARLRSHAGASSTSLCACASTTAPARRHHFGRSPPSRANRGSR